MLKFVVATGNQGKMAEFMGLTAGLDIELIAQADFDIESPEETGSTFVENAIIKARHAAAQSGLPSIADDSGLCVDCLDSAPGIISARYAGPDAGSVECYSKLLAEMRDVPADERSASFHSVVVLMEDENDPAPLICHGVWSGYILTEPRGEKGFGYDSVFYVPTHDCSAAELDLEQKNKISHRALAMGELLEILTEVMQ
jgi:XTP/dITP diphosphohydrolase